MIMRKVLSEINVSSDPRAFSCKLHWDGDDEGLHHMGAMKSTMYVQERHLCCTVLVTSILKNTLKVGNDK